MDTKTHGDLVAKCAALLAKFTESSEAVNKATLEKDHAKSALDQARKELKQFETEQKLMPFIIEAKAAITEWSSQKSPAEAAKRYYKAIRPIIDEDPQYAPILPVTAHEDMLILIHEMFSKSLDSFEITRKFAENHLCLFISENTEGALDEAMVRKIIKSFGIFDDDIAIVQPWLSFHNNREFVVMQKGSKYKLLTGGAWIDKTIFNFSRQAEKCNACNKWIPICPACKSNGKFIYCNMYKDKYGPVCSDPICKDKLGYVEISKSHEHRPLKMRACECG
ncbi:MAG: hypothetical protein Hyperionvirus4_111 [Hyperionvirus sp.]|uniref:Uncharacterized protein n=1 Tax=Hyperionvirus sp. TaxID=2487770 RepID=A0A3G5A7B7_9VIRU|nr:MAG: hypothetical protein Hyperionvirus4_111 [Hyperionvirus sp.]